MKKLLLLLLIATGFVACTKDDTQVEEIALEETISIDAPVFTGVDDTGDVFRNISGKGFGDIGDWFDDVSDDLVEASEDIHDFIYGPKPKNYQNPPHTPNHWKLIAKVNGDWFFKSTKHFGNRFIVAWSPGEAGAAGGHFRIYNGDENSYWKKPGPRGTSYTTFAVGNFPKFKANVVGQVHELAWMTTLKDVNSEDVQKNGWTTESRRWGGGDKRIKFITYKGSFNIKIRVFHQKSIGLTRVKLQINGTQYEEQFNGGTVKERILRAQERARAWTS